MREQGALLGRDLHLGPRVARGLLAQAGEDRGLVDAPADDVVADVVGQADGSCRSCARWCHVRPGRRKTYPTPRTVCRNCGRRRVRLDLAAQPVDVDVHRPRLAAVVVAPDVLEQLVAGEHLARVAEQEREQLERLGLERHGLAVAQHAVAGEVDLHPAEVDQRRRRRPPRACSARRKIARIRAVSSRRLNGLVT